MAAHSVDRLRRCLIRSSRTRTRTNVASGDLDRPDLQRLLVDHEMDFAPGAAFYTTMLAAVPFALPLPLVLDACALGQRVERFNGLIEEKLQGHHFQSGEDLETTQHRYVMRYNQLLTKLALGSKTPLQAMKDGHKLKPELFKKLPYHLPGSDI
jgi:hypothetical protein